MYTYINKKNNTLFFLFSTPSFFHLFKNNFVSCNKLNAKERIYFNMMLKGEKMSFFFNH